MEKRDYTEMMDALRDQNNALRDLLRLNWRKYEWAKELYYELTPLYERMRQCVYEEEENEKQKCLKANSDK